MPHIFISYKREEADTARKIRQALRADGFNVWWDENLQGGQQWDAAIDNALLDAGAVIVLWSPDSIRSDWVKHEASVAKSRGTLIPATIVECNPPPSFGSIHSINLTKWDGSERHSNYHDLSSAVANVLRKRSKNRLLRALLVIVILTFIFVSGVFTGRYGCFKNGIAPNPPDPDKKPTQIFDLKENNSLASKLEALYPSQIRNIIPAKPSTSKADSELYLSTSIQKFIDTGEYRKATELFEPLRSSHDSGVGYSSYPDIAFAFDKIGRPDDALRVMYLLAKKLDDAKLTLHYLSPGNPPREQFLPNSLSKYIPLVSSPNVKNSMMLVLKSLQLQ